MQVAAAAGEAPWACCKSILATAHPQGLAASSQCPSAANTMESLLL